MALTLPDLPYPKNGLEPHISANTLDFHYGKHHNAYVTKGNAALEGSSLANESMEKIIKETAGDASKSGIFNNVAQVWNHTFYWNSMKPNGGGDPTGAIADKITSDFGSFDKFKDEFSNAAATQFGSGWAWLVLDGSGKLKVTKSLNAENPISEGLKPIITIDVWEHAYYLDYQNKRPDYISTFLDKLVNWEFASKNLEA